MNVNERFDELARKKLEERAFPFQEEAWLDAQRAIRANRKRRLGAGWYISGIMAVGIAAWLLRPSNESVQVVESFDQGTGVELNNGENPESKQTREGTGTPNALGSPSRAEHADVSTDITRQAGSAQRTRSVRSAPIEQHATTSRSLTPNDRSIPLAMASDATEEAITSRDADHDAVADQVLPVQDNSVTDPHSATDGGVSPSAAAKSEQSSDVVADTDSSTPSTNIAVNDELVTSGSKSDDAIPAQAFNGASANPTVGNAADASIDTAVADEASLRAPDSSVVASMPSDSAMSAPPALPVAPPLVTPQSPWELSVLGGIFRSNSTYTGQGTDTWSIAQESSWGAGAELMHMGRNFGVGTGLHYGTYADRLSTPEVSNTVTTIEHFWYLANVDTTILLITGGDSLGGYTGISIPATVQVIQSGYDTTSISTLLRRASERVNRTSYIEVPLLMDAHVVQGRWSLGVRGGPTLGLLTTRSGSIPREGDEAYADLNDVTMRQYVFGWTARVYVRYRFNSAWSVGIEPSARGQLFDGLNDLGITRRSSAFGAMLSLSYRLR